MKKIVLRSTNVQTRNVGMLNPAPGSTTRYVQPYASYLGHQRAEAEGTLAMITSAVASDVADTGRFHTIGTMLGTDDDCTDRSPYCSALNVAASAQLSAASAWTAYALGMLYAGESYILEVGESLTPLVGGTVAILPPAADSLNWDGSPMLFAGYQVRNSRGISVGLYGPSGEAVGEGAIPGSRLHRVWFQHPQSLLRANSPVEAAGLTADVLALLHTATKSVLVNDGMPGGVLTVDAPDITDEEMTGLETRLNAKMSDPNRKGRTLVLNSETKYQQLGNTVLDGDWIGVENALRASLAAFFRVPESAFGAVGGMTYENQQVAGRAYRTQVLLPLRQKLLDTLNQSARKNGYVLSTEVVEGSDLDETQRADQELKAAQKVAAVAALNVATTDELREMLGLPPMKGEPHTAPAAPAPAATREAPPFEERATSPRKIKAETYSAAFDKASDRHEGEFADFAQAFHARVYRNITGALKRRANRAAGDEPLGPVTVDSLFDEAARSSELAADLPAIAAAVAASGADVAADATGVLSEFADDRPVWRQLLDVRVSRLVQGNGQYAGWARDIHDDLGKALASAYEAGESVDGAAARIADVLGVDPANPGAVGKRAMTIARTETLGLLNDSAQTQMRLSGVVTSKTWYSISDNRTRSTHSTLAGTTIPFTAKFDVGGVLADGPHDPGLPVGQVVNCRCRLIPGVE